MFVLRSWVLAKSGLRDDEVAGAPDSKALLCWPMLDQYGEHYSILTHLLSKLVQIIVVFWVFGVTRLVLP